jgi:hypothetical protein
MDLPMRSKEFVDIDSLISQFQTDIENYIRATHSEWDASEKKEDFFFLTPYMAYIVSKPRKQKFIVSHPKLNQLHVSMLDAKEKENYDVAAIFHEKAMMFAQNLANLEKAKLQLKDVLKIEDYKEAAKLKRQIDGLKDFVETYDDFEVDISGENTDETE